MKKLIILLIISVFYVSANAQVAGDTIVVQSYDYSHNNYGSGNKDTMVNFPNDPNLTFEKIIMKYNMRCKGGAVGSQVPPGGTTGCGKWDYSCSTYIVDSTKPDSTRAHSLLILVHVLQALYLIIQITLLIHIINTRSKM